MFCWPKRVKWLYTLRMYMTLWVKSAISKIMTTVFAHLTKRNKSIYISISLSCSLNYIYSLCKLLQFSFMKAKELFFAN